MSHFIGVQLTHGVTPPQWSVVPVPETCPSVERFLDEHPSTSDCTRATPLYRTEAQVLADIARMGGTVVELHMCERNINPSNCPVNCAWYTPLV